MRAPISVIIPTLNAAQTLGPCLLSLSEALTNGLLTEVIFADGGSSDDTAQIAEEVGAVVSPSPKGRGTQMAAAADQAKGEWFLFLHADSVLENGWVRVAQNHLTHPDKAGYFHLKFDDNSLPAQLVAGWANLRARIFGLPYGDQGLLISRKLYDEIGGYPSIPLMEDVAISRKLRGNLRALPIDITTRADKYQRDGWWRRSFANFRILLRYLAGADPEKLADEYYAKQGQ